MWRRLLVLHLRHGHNERFLNLFLNECEPLFGTERAASEMLYVALELMNPILHCREPLRKVVHQIRHPVAVLVGIVSPPR